MEAEDHLVSPRDAKVDTIGHEVSGFHPTAAVPTQIRAREMSGNSRESNEYLSRVDSILPILRANANETERLGKVAPESFKALASAGVFRAIQPKRWGGLEVPPWVWYESIVRVGTACTSSAWVQAILGGHQWYVGLYADEAQREVWKDNRQALTASSYAPTGKVQRVDGGFHVTGRWNFCSGIDYAEWVVVGAVLPDDGNGAQYRVYLVPVRDVQIVEDSWKVVCLGGTGSKAVIVDSIVPEYRTHTIEDAYHGTEPGRATNPGPLFKMPWFCMFGHVLSSVTIGALFGALDVFIEEQKTRISGFSGKAVNENPFLYNRLAQSMTIANDLRTRIRRDWEAFYATVESGAEISELDLAQVRYETTHAMARSLDAAISLMECSGGGVFTEGKPFQRFLRDLMGARNHPFAVPELWSPLYARILLGMGRAPFTRPSMHCVL